jgi:hypothetical protein
MGGFVAIGALALLGPSLSVTLLLGSFGASCVLLFGFPDAPFAQPANGRLEFSVLPCGQRRCTAGADRLDLEQRHSQHALPALLVAASYRFGIPGKNAFVRRM